MRRIRGSNFKPISEYGVIGDIRSAALIGTDGSIDWWCVPRFDSPSIFGALLDAERGGHFRVTPVRGFTSKQRYFPLTNILVTTFHLHDGTGAFEILDFMPGPSETPIADPHELYRRIRGLFGHVEVEVEFAPRFDYGRSEMEITEWEYGVVAIDDLEALTLRAPHDVKWEIDSRAAVARTAMTVSREHDLWLGLAWGVGAVPTVDASVCQKKLNDTALFWNDWAGKLSYNGMYRAEVERSALALKLMFYGPTGAVVAAPTASLPEEIGGVRNWDYRYCWVRDAAFTISALNIVGLHDEAHRFRDYLQWIASKSDDPLQIMYGIGGEVDLPESVLAHLSGYRNSAPVRIGNHAHAQLQLDIYGELLAAVHLSHQQHPVDETFWELLIEIVDWVADNWHRPDHGIWEIRSEPRHYVHSKVMCWVALDRAIEMATSLGAPASIENWKRQRDAIHDEVLTRGFNQDKLSFVQSYGSDVLDAANLLIPVYGFLPGNDARVLGTVQATLRELTHNGMLYRYTSADGLPGTEGVFSICTFWLADALILSGDVVAGERVFKRMLRFANPLGLYSEQIDPMTGDFLGNFPQAFTHIALINTAYLLERTAAEAEQSTIAGRANDADLARPAPRAARR